MTKEKNTAKVRLLTALNQSKLEVPASVLKLEGELKKEWEGENRKIKKAAAGGSSNAKVAKTKNAAGGGAQMSPSSQGFNVNGKSEAMLICFLDTSNLHSQCNYQSGHGSN